MRTVTRPDLTTDQLEGRWRRRLFFFAAALAIAYALFAGLHTVDDFDTGWQIATGRYIVQHKTIPSTDVLSYTAAGAQWIYPWLGQVLLYLVFAAAGFTGLSWLACAATVGTTAALLWEQRTATALLALLAVPSIVYRTNARSELFTTVFFAIFFMLLWRYHRGARIPLWALPLCMLLWVNLHPGFIAGFACIGAYLLLEAESWLREREATAARLKRIAPWLGVSVLATLVNPWGYRIFVTAARQSQSVRELGSFIGEWARPQLSAAMLPQVFSVRDPDASFWWLVLAGAVGVVAAIWRKQFAAALILGSALFLALRFLRFQGLAAILIVVLAGAALSEIRISAVTRQRIAMVVLASLTILTGLRVFDLVTNRVYVQTGQIAQFGAGPSWWYPVKAAEFIKAQKLPANVFNPYTLGGFTAWRLGPEYKTYTDGRAIPFGADLLLRQQELLGASPDDALWAQEVAYRNINTAFFSVARYAGLSNAPLRAFCGSKEWSLGYLDEVSAVFVRKASAASIPARDCASAPIPPTQDSSRIARFNHDANAAAVLLVLGRDEEALRAADSAGLLFDDGNLQLTRGQILQAMGRMDEAERAYRRATEWRRSDAMFLALARFYAAQKRYPAAETALRESAELSYEPHQRWRQMGQLHNLMQKPQEALADFDRSDRLAQSRGIASALADQFFAQTANGRAHAYRALGNLTSALEWQEKAAALMPQSAGYWNELADLYAQTNQPEKSNAARERAAKLQSRTSPAQ
jgi:tetratricopeptide (TPR) repeat protein